MSKITERCFHEVAVIKIATGKGMQAAGLQQWPTGEYARPWAGTRHRAHFVTLTQHILKCPRHTAEPTQQARQQTTVIPDLRGSLTGF